MNEFNGRLYERYRTIMGDEEDDHSWRRPRLRHLIKAHFPKRRDAGILDLGCGAGFFLQVLREEGYSNLTGVDVSPEQVAIAQRNGLDMVRHDDLFEFLRHAASDSYDVLIAYDVIEHLEKDALLDLADEVFRILRPGGFWMVHAPNAEGMFPARARWADLTHTLAFTPDSISQLARAAGFEGARCFADKPVVHDPVSAVRRFLYELARLPLRFAWLAETGSLGRPWICSQNLFSVARKSSDD